MERKFLNLIYPENIYCVCCDDSMENTRVHGICDNCVSKIDWTLDNPLRSVMDEHVFDDLQACCRYGLYPRTIIHRLKFDGKGYIARGIGLLMNERLRASEICFDYITEVPMTRRKAMSRGYNQAELLAEYASSGFEDKYISGLLLKTKDTASARLSDMRARFSLLDDSVKINTGFLPAIHGKHIVLVDDIVTTGSTADACARVLKENGAERVTVLCFSAASDPLRYEA